MRIWLVVMLLLICVMGPEVARAEEDGGQVEVVRLRFAERGDQLVVKAFDMRPLIFDDATLMQLYRNPVATEIAVRLFVYQKDETQPLSFRPLTARIVYDLWNEVYEVRVDTVKGRRDGRHRQLHDAVAAIAYLENLSLVNLERVVPEEHYFLGVVIELNPISEETMAEMRRWLTRPAGAGRFDRTSSFFGSFVSLFVNAKIPEADRVVRARSQPFYRASPRAARVGE